DKRSLFLDLSQSGREAKEILDKVWMGFTEQALGNFSREEAARVNALMARFVGVQQKKIHYVLQERLTSRPLESEELQSARAFLTLEIVRTNRLLQMSDQLLSADSRIVGLYREEDLVGVLEFQNHESPRLINAAVIADQNIKDIWIRFLLSSITECITESGSSTLLVAHSSGLAPLFSRMSFGEKVEGGILVLREEIEDRVSRQLSSAN
ncbi:MAG: hypothetical protein KDD70_16415, partial [Bdellovibrionales bacterium]|nr:hypothetical protein [Bdellovibrionales bacterium]